MRDAAGQLADGIHLLQLPQLFFRSPMGICRFLIGGDVPADDIDQSLLGGQRPVDPPIRSVLVAKAVFHAHGAGALGETSPSLMANRRVIRMAQYVDMQRPDFLFAPAERLRPGRVYGWEVALEIANTQQVFRNIPDPVALARPLGQKTREPHSLSRT